MASRRVIELRDEPADAHEFGQFGKRVGQDGFDSYRGVFVMRLASATLNGLQRNDIGLADKKLTRGEASDVGEESVAVPDPLFLKWFDSEVDLFEVFGEKDFEGGFDIGDATGKSLHEGLFDESIETIR